MVEYKYNVELEMFKRVDNRGPPLPFNITEARRVDSMMNLGMKAPTIFKKIDFNHEVSMTNLRTFMNNLENGNIVDLYEDYPAPVGQFEDMNTEARLASLENRVQKIEEAYIMKSDSFCTCHAGNNEEEKESLINKVKKWMPKS